MNKKFLILLSVILVGLLFLGVLFISKKPKNELNDNKHESEKENQLVEKNATVVAQEDENLKIKLKFKSREGTVRSIMRYYIALYKADSRGKNLGYSPIDITMYDDKILLVGSKAEVEREIIYKKPDYLAGKYNLVAEYVNEAGVSMESINLSSIELKGNENGFLEISPESCYLHVAGEAKGKKYDLMQGVDVFSKEDLLATCSIESHFASNISVTPQFDNFRRKNFYLEQDVPQENIVPATIAFNPKEKKEVTFSIAKALEPQAYDASLVLQDEKGKELSTKIFIHYVITGESATVRDAILDRESYIAGATAKLTILSSGSADNFDDSRNAGSKNDVITGEVDILGNDNATCLSERKIIDLTKANVLGTQVDLPIQRDCQKPYIKTIIKGSGGKILGEKIFLKEFE